MTVVFGFAGTYKVAAADAPTSAAAWTEDYLALQSSTLSNAVHEEWAAAFESPQWRTFVASRERAAASGAHSPAAPQTLLSPFVTAPEFASGLRDTARLGDQTPPTDAVTAAAVKAVNGVIASSAYQQLVSETAALLDEASSFSQIRLTSRLVSGPRVGGPCPAGEDDVQCAAKYMQGFFDIGQGAAKLSCLDEPETCPASALVWGGVQILRGLVDLFVQAYEANKPPAPNDCSDSASMGDYVDQLGTQYVVLYNDIECNATANSIDVGEQMTKDGTGYAGDGYTCNDTSYCQPDLLVPYPPHGSCYSGSNDTVVDRGVGNFYEQYHADAGTLCYATD